MRRPIYLTLVIALSLVLLSAVQPAMAQHAPASKTITDSLTDPELGLLMRPPAEASLVTLSSEDAGTETVEADVRIFPRTLNLKSKGKWVLAIILLPEGYDVHDIALETVLLEDSIPPEDRAIWIGDDDDDAVASSLLDDDEEPTSGLGLKFSRQALIELLEPLMEEKVTEVELTVAGELSDGTPFEGSATVKVRKPGKP